MSLADLFADAAPALGLSRPAGLCLAAIWRAQTPPCADDLCDRYGLARSNVSVALKELRSWGLIAVQRRSGDRKDYFTAPDAAEDLIGLVMAGQRRRVLAPLVDRLQVLAAEDHDAAVLDAALRAREAPDAAATPASGGGKKKKKRKRDHG